MSSIIAISDKSRSAIVALTELARRDGGGPVPIVEISEARDIPLHVLEQLFSALRRAGVLASQRGVKGGYSFLRAPAEVTLLEVVETVDGRIGVADEAATGIDAVWADARSLLVGLLADRSIADMVEDEERASAAPMFYI
jgi:Rrf2 family transcriptional regulator, cysteine metabolism repressor